MKISQKIFSKNDQNLFAQFSGDFNDIHCNEINARKKIYGECIVHGINAALWSLDQLVKHINNVKLNMKIIFHEPIFLNEKINLEYNKKEKVLLIKSNKKTTIIINFINQDKNVALNKVLPKNKKNLKFSKKNLINNIKIGDKKNFSIRGNPNLSIKIFPNLVKQYGIFTITEIAALSQLVGMECPGENSTFVSLTISQNNLDLKPSFQVDKIDKRFGLILINVMGNSICSDLKVLMSNNEKKSEDTKISKLKSYIGKNEFLNVNALIIGGSRGLGKLVSKIICSGGGSCTITYNVGKKEAIDLCSEINSKNLLCETEFYNSSRRDKFIYNKKFNQVYYFATPKILGSKKSKFNEKLYRSFKRVYVTDFKYVCTQVQKYNPKCKIFSPSTNFIDKPVNNFNEYIEAKKELEKVSLKLINEKNLIIINPRLPRFDTDQNQSIMNYKFADPIEILVSCIRKMNY